MNTKTENRDLLDEQPVNNGTMVSPPEHTLEVQPVDQNPYVNMLAVATEKDMDVEKLEKLMDLQERWEDRKAKREFVSAMAKFQSLCPAAFRSSSSDKHDYAPIEVIVKTIKPHLAKCGLSVRFSTEQTPTSMTAICKVAHVGGYEESSSYTCIIENVVSKSGKNVMNAAQAGSSADSYAKRYALKNAFNIVESYDDDGESLGRKPELITPEQAANLRDELEKLEGDEAFFCNWLCKVESLDDVPLTMLGKAQKAINEQKAQKK